MKKTIFIVTLQIAAFLCTKIYSQNVDIDVNLNIKHAVDGVSDFGRDRHITVHSTPTENDWIGEESKLDYLINDLKVGFGRDNGSATWKFKDTPEDPKRKARADIDAMQLRANYLKNIYDNNNLAHQYEKRGAMIMGTNPFPLYPTLNWYDIGKTTTGWQPWNVETSAEWVIEYLDKYFRKNDGESGEPLPKYWEVINEPDMEMMTGSMFCTSQEKLWEFHNLVATGVKARMGSKAPKIGGMTWGQHDLYLQDGVNRYDSNYLDQYLTTESKPIYHAMMDSPVSAFRTQNWYQWDVMWQGFIDNCGANMDFHSVHLYDWPDPTSKDKGVLRTGAQIEATLDMLEWYDIYKLGKRKEIVLSEFGSVSPALDIVSYKRRAWENLRPFNAMFMQFLERPSQIVYSMPFSPIKAEWGDWKDANGNITRRYPSTLMDKDANGKWQWNDFVLFYELWKDVDGTRVETKSTNLDIQVDSYINGNHVYLILNNLSFTSKTLNLNLYNDNTNAIKNVKMSNLYLDLAKGANGESVFDKRTFTTAPGSIQIAGEATIILDYTFENPIAINQTCNEKKYMGQILETGTTSIGGVKFRKSVNAGTALTTQVNNVTVPTIGEGVLRISGKFWKSGMTPSSIKVNGNALTFTKPYRGETRDSRNVWFGTYEVDVPLAYLQANNTISCTVSGNVVEYTTVSLQVFDFSKAPKRAKTNTTVAVNSLTIDPATMEVMVGKTKTITATIAPENATNKKITWTSENNAIASVDEFGIVTGKTVGVATISATSVDGNFKKTTVVTVSSYTPKLVTGISIAEGRTLDIKQYVTTKLNSVITPIDATEQNTVWTSSNPSVAEVDAKTGKVVGKVLYGTANITATITDPNNANQVFTDLTTVTVQLAGEFVNTTGITANPSSKTLRSIGEKFTLTATVAPFNATVKTFTWSSSNNGIATVSENGIVTAVASGTATITATTTNGNFTANSEIKVEINVGGGSNLIIQAESFSSTGGTYNDNFVPSPYGVNKTTTAINYVNSDDWVLYNFNVPKTGNYVIVYYISTPSANAQIKASFDGVVTSTDNVPNNGAWDTYGPLTAANTISLTAGAHTMKLTASGSNAWQWNLDRIELQEIILGVEDFESSLTKVTLHPNPATNSITISGDDTNEAYNINIYNLQGVLLKTIKTNNLPNTIDISNFAEGPYFLNLGNHKNNKVFKFIKK